MGKATNCLFRLFLIALLFVCAFFAIVCFIIGEILAGCFMLFFALILLAFVVSYSSKTGKEKGNGLSLKETLFMPVGKVLNIDADLASQIIADFKANKETSELCKLCEAKSESQKNETLVYAFKKLINEYLHDGSLTEEEGGRIINFFTQGLHLDISLLQKEKEYSNMCKLIVINSLANGKIPTGINVNTGGQFVNMEAGEQIIADQTNATYNEIVEKKTRYGYSGGTSTNLGHGRYSRFGSFVSMESFSQDIVTKGVGTLLLTNKNIYFLSNQKTVKIPYDKILSYSTYSDGLGIHLSDSRRRPIVIGKVDGWFVYNVVTNIQNIS